MDKALVVKMKYLPTKIHTSNYESIKVSNLLPAARKCSV